MDFLHQQADRGDLNVSYLSKYILNMMVLLCAPVRDEAVQRLENVSDPVRLLRCDSSCSLLTCSGLSWEGLADAGRWVSRPSSSSFLACCFSLLLKRTFGSSVARQDPL